MTSGLSPIHLINLDRSTERVRRFRELNGHLTDITRIPATDGSTLDRKALEVSGYITGDLSYGAGALWCAFSHVRLSEMMKEFYGGLSDCLIHLALTVAPFRRVLAALEYCRPLRNRMIDFPGVGVRTFDQGIGVALCGLYSLWEPSSVRSRFPFRAKARFPSREEIDSEAAHGK